MPFVAPIMLSLSQKLSKCLILAIYFEVIFQIWVGLSVEMVAICSPKPVISLLILKKPGLKMSAVPFAVTIPLLTGGLFRSFRLKDWVTTFDSLALAHS